MAAGEHTTIALTVLRERMEAAHSRAALLERRSAEEWEAYCRQSDAAREAWREHRELLDAVRVLEAAS